MSLLDGIVAAKREEVAALAHHAAALRHRAESAPPVRPLESVLRRLDTVVLIAEVKRRSPSAGPIRPGLDPTEVAVAFEGAGASAISVLTDRQFFGGSMEDLEAARAAVALPVLRKDFLLDAVQVWEARAAGADAILLIVKVLEDPLLLDLLALARELGVAALVEVHEASELERALAAGATLIGVNNRDLETFRTDLGVAAKLASLVPPDRMLVAESGISSASDVDLLAAQGVDAVLVGELLMRSADPGAVAAGLVGRPRHARLPRS